MGSTQLKEELHKYINRADVRFLKVVHAMMKQYIKDLDVVGHNSEGFPISKEEVVIRARLSNNAIKQGRVKSARQVRKESKNW